MSVRFAATARGASLALLLLHPCECEALLFRPPRIACASSRPEPVVLTPQLPAAYITITKRDVAVERNGTSARSIDGRDVRPPSIPYIENTVFPDAIRVSPNVAQEAAAVRSAMDSFFAESYNVAGFSKWREEGEHSGVRERTWGTILDFPNPSLATALTPVMQGLVDHVKLKAAASSRAFNEIKVEDLYITSDLIRGVPLFIKHNFNTSLSSATVGRIAIASEFHVDFDNVFGRNKLVVVYGADEIDPSLKTTYCQYKQNGRVDLGVVPSGTLVVHRSATEKAVLHAGPAGEGEIHQMRTIIELKIPKELQKYFDDELEARPLRTAQGEVKFPYYRI